MTVQEELEKYRMKKEKFNRPNPKDKEELDAMFLFMKDIKSQDVCKIVSGIADHIHAILFTDTWFFEANLMGDKVIVISYKYVDLLDVINTKSHREDLIDRGTIREIIGNELEYYPKDYPEIIKLIEYKKRIIKDYFSTYNSLAEIIKEELKLRLNNKTG